MVMRTSGIDVILGLDWMKKYTIEIKCNEKMVVLTTPKGERISVDVVVQALPTTTVKQLDDDVDPQNLVVNEFLDVFQMNCLVCHLTETLNLLLNYYLVLHP